MPLRDKIIMLLLRYDCLSGEVAIAVKGGNDATAMTMAIEMEAVAKEARQIMERMLAQ